VKQTAYYSEGLANWLTMFPKPRRLDLEPGMVNTFADCTIKLGPRWQPILNTFWRNDGLLKICMFQNIVDQQWLWWSGAIQTKTSISIPTPARGRLPLRETIWAMKEVASAVHEYVDTKEPVPWLIVQYQGKEHKVRLLGVPEDICWRHCHRRLQKNVATS
jgi:hypothetical protein